MKKGLLYVVAFVIAIGALAWIVKLKNEVNVLKSGTENVSETDFESESKSDTDPTQRKATLDQLPSMGFTNDEIIDLGLSVKWANCNVGASKMYELGNLFAWGEIKTKPWYDEDNSITYEKSRSLLYRKGVINEKCNLKLLYDAASIHCGNNYRMPTVEECTELLNNCKWFYLTIVVSPDKQVFGYYGKSKINGKSIFFPANCNFNGYAHGYYWSSSDYGDKYGVRAYGIVFGKSDVTICTPERYVGNTIRPVYE